MCLICVTHLCRCWDCSGEPCQLVRAPSWLYRTHLSSVLPCFIYVFWQNILFLINLKYLVFLSKLLSFHKFLSSSSEGKCYYLSLFFTHLQSHTLSLLPPYSLRFFQGLGSLPCLEPYPHLFLSTFSLFSEPCNCQTMTFIAHFFYHLILFISTDLVSLLSL